MYMAVSVSLIFCLFFQMLLKTTVNFILLTPHSTNQIIFSYRKDAKVEN